MKHKFVAKRYWKEEVPPMSIVDKLAQRYDDVDVYKRQTQKQSL